MVRGFRTRLLGSALVVLAIGSLAAPAAASIPSRAWGKPCSLVKTSEVEAITGVAIVRTKANAGPVDACLYYDASSPAAVVGIWLNAKPLTGTAPNQYGFDAKQAKTNSINENFQNVSGIGKKAFFFESEIFNRIEVLVDKRLFHVDGSALTLDQAEGLARKVVAKS